MLRGVLMFMFVLRYCGLRRPVIEAVSWLYYVAGTPWRSSASFMSVEAIYLWYLAVLLASAYFFFLQTRVSACGAACSKA